MRIRRLGIVTSYLASHIRSGDWSAVRVIVGKAVSKLAQLLLLPVGLVLTFILRAIRPWFLVRISILTSERIGHLAANTEMYLCERDAGMNIPGRPHIDLWYHNWPVCNRQLAVMLGRALHVGPRWLLGPIDRVNAWIPGGAPHRIGDNTQVDRDVHNLLDRFPPHLRFLPDEERRGQEGMAALGIPSGTPFVCVSARDPAFLARSIPWKSWNYHDYRDSDVNNYELAAMELVKRGYYVIRMGAVVAAPLRFSHPMVIDYAANGMRTEFMDVYLGAKCAFCISSGTGFDAIPYVFRRPIVYVDFAPVGHTMTFSEKFVSIPKKYWLRPEDRPMTLTEIMRTGAGHFFYTQEYERAGIELVGNTPEEIAEAAVEMERRLKGEWQSKPDDEAHQRRFWEIFAQGISANGLRRTHGELRSRIGAAFLRRNPSWLE